ncbi:MAG TPA: CHAD domain-containing protein [Gammaproteobacteria bacterium]|nr:CHAD domain-containing protein [Gammaproteobacteria bacterium]
MDFSLDPAMPAYSALSSVLLFNLDIMEVNEKGIMEDADIEFLHDFRVANRRSRSLVTRVKHVYPKTGLGHFRRAFSWLSKLTSTHRDLDVFLADFATYEMKIPVNSGGELESLRGLLQEKREIEHGKLVKALDSRRFNTFKHDWRCFLEEGNRKPPDAPKSMTPIMDVASESIRDNFRKLLKQGNRINRNYNFEAIHKLRKDGKKLRYLLETFKSLYPADDVSRVIKNLKKIQDNLGDIVDMHMQQIMLEDWKQAMQNRSNVPENTIKAIEYLESLCREEEKKAGEKFRKRFSRFSNKGNRGLFG